MPLVSRALFPFAALSVLLCVPLLNAPLAYAGSPSQVPGGLEQVDVSVDPDPGTSYPWEGQSGGTNTGNATKPPRCR